MTTNVLGHGARWAWPRGSDDSFKALMTYIGNLTVVELLSVAEALSDLHDAEPERSVFLSVVQGLKSAPIDTVRETLSHPVWVYWIRANQRYIGAIHNRRVPERFWTGHLRSSDAGNSMKMLRESLQLSSLLALVVRMKLGIESETRVPYTGDRYLAMPGTGLSLDVPERCRSGDSLDVRFCHRTPDTSVLELGREGTTFKRLEIPTTDGRIDIGGEGASLVKLAQVVDGNNRIEIDNRDPRFVQNWVRGEVYDGLAKVKAASDSEIGRWEERIANALALLHQFSPLLTDELTELITSIVPVETSQHDHNVSVSSRDFWRAIQCSPHPGIAMADVLAHEYRHNLLNAILDADPILSDSAPTGAAFYSPWRPDRRPLLGLIHGIYSFLEVVGFYSSYLEHFGDSENQASEAEYNLALNAYRLKVATQEFGEVATLTEFGSQLLIGIDQRVAEYWGLAQQVSNTVRRRAIQGVDQHRIDWNIRHGLQ